ncbi:hypothetical protein [Stygiolobus caldivivus]|uniref:Uncharacterized protein n=1 Tax=Stygiolobus caldivivus TaxID=2824673 RepID=A0A8D5UA65_9CREN|nr:hypothetical protein [Stygiolobus caldivivus]BCU71469.1 hypothetical protein KN1_27660 [Stygiolobus caldivivus]
MRLEIENIDSILSSNERVEFYGGWDDVLFLAHRAVAASAPVNVVLVQEFGKFDPFLVKKFQRLLGNTSEVFIRRAFKAEDVKPTIESFDKELIVIDPYFHGKKYTEITSSLRREVWVFTREVRGLPQGGAFNHHSMHVIVKVKRSKWGFRFYLIKHPTMPYMEIPVSIEGMYKGEESNGLLAWAGL